MKSIIRLIDEYQKLGIETCLNYSKFNEYFLTYHSTAIEGSTLYSGANRIAFR